MSSMAEETEKEKPKFVCKLCKLDYPSSVQFEEHLWSMLHHKAINNKALSTKHHCNLCMFESFDLNAYGKHLIGEQHKRSLVERRKRLEEPRQIKRTAPATSCSKRSESQTAQGTNQRVESTRWGPPTHTIPNQTGYHHGGYSQSQEPNTFQHTSKSNTNYHYGEQFIYNQGEWQNPHNQYSWRPPQGRLEQPSVGSWENKSTAFNPKQRFPTPTQAVQQQYEKSTKRPVNLKAQEKVGKKKQGKNKAHCKKDNVTSTVKIKKATHHSVASHGSSAQGSHCQKPAQKPAEQALVQSESVPYVKVARGPTPSKNQKKKKQKKPSLKIKGQFVTKKKFLKSLQNQSSATSHPSPMKQAVKALQSLSKPTQSSEIASTKHSAPSKDNAVSTKTFPKATSAINRFEMNLREALHGKDDVPGDEIVEVTSSDVAGISGKAADHSATFLTSTSSMVSSSAAVTPFQFAQEQYTWKKERSAPHSSSSAADKRTFKIHHQKESMASTNKESVSETAACHLPNLARSISPTVPSAAVSSFHSLNEQNGKWSAEIRCASSSDKLASKINSHTESSSTAESSSTGTHVQDIGLSSSTGTPEDCSNHKELVKRKSKGTASDESSISVSKFGLSSSTGTPEECSNHKELVKSKSEETASDKSSTSVSKFGLSSSTGTPEECSNHKELVKSKSEGTASEESSTSVSKVGLSSSTGTQEECSNHKELVKSKSEGTASEKSSTSVSKFGLSSSTGTPEDCSNHKELVKSKSEGTTSDESSTSVSKFARSSSAPATLPIKELSAGNQPLLSKVLVNEQQKQKLNPRPNLTNARSRLRTNKDAEHPPGGQIFKEKIQGLLSDVAKPVWQQKKIRMMLAKAKKAPDRFNRFSHLASSPSRSEDPIDESLDVMNLSTEFQQELLDLIQSENADEEDILSQLTAPEASETREANQQDFVGRSTPAESLKPSRRHGEGTLGGIQEAVPLMSQGLHERSHTVTTATPVLEQQQGLQETWHPSHALSSRSSTPVIKLERLDSPELMDPHLYQPSLVSERLPHEGHSHPGFISSIESRNKPYERGSTERHRTVTSVTPVIRQELLTIADLDTHALHSSQLYKEQNHPDHVISENPDDMIEERGPSERHDASVTSTSTIPPMTVIDSSEASEQITKSHKHKKKKKEKRKSKDKDPSPGKKVKKTSTLEKTPKLKESKSATLRRKSVQSSISGRVSKTKSPTVLTANKLKKKFKQKRKMLDTMVGDMSSLLEITLQENKLQAKMDKLTAKIDNVVEIIQEKEAMLKSFKQQKDVFISSLRDLREKRLNLLLGLTSGDKSDSSPSVNKRNGSRTDEGPSSSNNTKDLAPALPRGGLQNDRHQADASDSAQSGGEGGIKISHITSMAATTPIGTTTPSHRTEGFRIMFGSPTRSEGDQGHGIMDTFGDVGYNRDGLGIDVGSPPLQSHVSQSIEMVPHVMSRESLAKTLQELNSCGGGVKVDILSDEETLHGIGCERLMHPESFPPNSDVIGAVAKLVRGHVMSPDRDCVMQSMGSSTVSDVTVEPYQMAVGSDQEIVQRRTGEYRAQGTLSLQSDTEEGLSVTGPPYRNVTSSEPTLKKIKQEPQDHYDISQRQETLDHGEASFAKRKRRKEVSEENQTKRPKPNSKDPIMSKIKRELDTLLDTTSSAYPPEHDNTLIPQMENTHNYQSKVSSAPYPSGSRDNNNDNPSESLTSLEKNSEPNTAQQSALWAGDASSQEKASSSPRSKGYVINMYIIVDKLYACISDSRFIIFNLKTNEIDAEEDLALGNIKYFELWRDTAASKMVAFASDGSRNLVQFDVQGKEFLQTLVLGKEITCLHVKWNSLYAGLVDGDIANINIQKSKVSWYYDCTPSFAVTALSSTLEGGMALLITASEDRTVTIRRADDGLLLRSLDGHHDVVTHLQVLGCRVLSMARSNTILIHNLDTGDMIQRVKHQTKMACCVMSGDMLAVASHTGNVYYYNLETGQADIFDSGCGNITCMTASQDMLFLGIRDGFIDVIPLYPSTVYKCEWSHCISRFLRVAALKTHLQHIHIRRSARQCLWKTCLKNYPQKNTTLKVIEQHVFSHLKDLGKQ